MGVALRHTQPSISPPAAANGKSCRSPCVRGVDKSRNPVFFFFSFRGQELVEEDIDWWSKYYASLSDYDKCGDYIERGYDKIIVCTYEIIVAFPWYFSSVSYELILALPIFILLWKYVVAFIECSLSHKVRKTQI